MTNAAKTVKKGKKEIRNIISAKKIWMKLYPDVCVGKRVTEGIVYTYVFSKAPAPIKTSGRSDEQILKLMIDAIL